MAVAAKQCIAADLPLIRTDLLATQLAGFAPCTDLAVAATCSSSLDAKSGALAGLAHASNHLQAACEQHDQAELALAPD